MSDIRGSSGNVIAALASFFLAGLGQLIQGRILSALLFCVFTYGGYAFWWLIFPAVIGAMVHLWSIINAATWKPRG